MMNDLNGVLNLLEDAIDTENWELVRQSLRRLAEIYERMEIGDQWGENYDE